MIISGINEVINDRVRYANNMAKKNAVKSGFENHISNVANSSNIAKTTSLSSGNLVIHGIFGETDSEGYTVVGAWGDAQTGTSTTVYKPADFDESNPVYRVKIWDSYGNVTERDVNLNEVNVSNCDTFDFYAYSCYLSNSGKYPSAMQDFMMTHAHYKGEEGFGKSSYSDMFVKFDWTSVIKSLMSMQYRCGNIKGYWDYRNFYDFLEG